MFKLPREADSWFLNIRKKMSIDFDIYYLCLLAGLTKGVKESRSTAETRDLVPRFPQEYRSESKIIVSLILTKELEKLGVSLEDKSIMHDIIKKYIDSDSPSGLLSDEGQREMNRYANAGFQIIKEFFNERPVNIEPFLINYSQMIEELSS